MAELLSPDPHSTFPYNPHMLFTLGAWLHDLDPFAIRFPEGFPLDGIRWYGLSYLTGFVAGYLVVRRVTRVGKTPLKMEQVSDLVVTLALCAVIGGRLGYAIFYQRELLTTFTSHPPFWDLLALNKGGMASHGGIIGAIIGCVYFSRKHKMSWSHLVDLTAFGAPPGLLFGRLANFVNGELLGRSCSEDFPLAVKFPQELPLLYNTDPQKVEPLLEQFRSQDTHVLEQPYATMQRIITLVQEGDEQAAAAVKPVLTALHPSQLYQGFAEGIVIFVILAWMYRRPVKPGMVGATFLLSYGVLRVITEQFRRPDEHIGYQLFGLTRGQWLSFGLIAGGIALLVIFSRQNVEKLGGWLGEKGTEARRHEGTKGKEST